MSVCDDRACCGGLCACISIVCFAGSLLAHGLLVWEVDPMRDTCEELAYETLAALGANLIVFVLGCLSTGAAVDAWWGQILAGLSALVVILSSRLTLFVHEAHLLCAADRANAPALPQNDLLVDEDVRGTLGAHAWAALLLFGIAVLLQQYSLLSGCDDPCDDPCPPAPRRQWVRAYTDRPPPCPPPCPTPCEDPRAPCPPSRDERAPMVRGAPRKIRQIYVFQQQQGLRA